MKTSQVLFSFPALLSGLSTTDIPPNEVFFRRRQRHDRRCRVIAALIGLLETIHLIMIFERYFRYWYDHLLIGSYSRRD